MKPVDQTSFGVPGGNCFSACVASLLELPIDDVPYFMGVDDWLPPFQAWLQERGFSAICVKLGNGWEPPGLCILGGRSPRGDHAVVGRGMEVVHDPHPSRDGLLSIEDCTILLPLDPMRSA